MDTGLEQMETIICSFGYYPFSIRFIYMLLCCYQKSQNEPRSTETALNEIQYKCIDFREKAQNQSLNQTKESILFLP